MANFKIYKNIAFAVALTLGIANSYALSDKDLEKNWPATTKKDIEVAKNATRIVPELLKHHFNPITQNVELSKKLYEETFKGFDPQKTFFLQEDIDLFRAQGARMLNLMSQGNIDIPLHIYSIYKARVAERVIFVKKLLENPIDTNQDTTFVLDRKDAEWCKTKKELDDVWRKRIASTYINYEIMNKSLNKKNSEKKDGEKCEKDQKTMSALRKNPKQRLLDFYDRLQKETELLSIVEVTSIFLSQFSHMFDPHTDYMSPDEVEEFKISMQNSLMGIGATLQEEEQFIKISDMVQGGPAAKDGRLKKGDYIIAVRQEGEEEPLDLVDMPLRRAIRHIRGKKDTIVHLTVMQPGEDARIIDIKRDEITLEEGKAKVTFKEVDAPDNSNRKIKVAYIDLPSFYYDCAIDFRKCVEQAISANADSVILDFRLNGGGSLQDCVKIAGLFFGSGPVVQSKMKSGIERFQDPDKKTLFAGPVVVLTDDFSASASEIVAACLQDYGRAVIVGTPRTHGKGTVQNVLPLAQAFNSLFKRKDEIGSQKLTIAKFYRVNGGSTQLKGVVPDIQYLAYSSAIASYEEELPTALAWDEISPLKYSCPIDVRPFIPTLKERSQKRVANNEEYQKQLKDIANLTTIMKQKEVSLNKEKRMAQNDITSELTKKMFIPRNIGVKLISEEEKEKKEEKRDFLLEEAHSIIADLTILQSGGKLK